MNIIDAKTLREHVELADLLEPVATAFTAYSSGDAGSAPVSLLTLPAPGEAHIKSGYIRGYQHFVVKVATSFPGNVAKGLSPLNGMMIAFDADTGRPVAVLHDESYLTDLRTAVAGALAARVLAPATLGTVGVLGTGVQARLQVEALRLVRAFQRVLVWGRNVEKAEATARDLRASLPDITVEVHSERQTLVAQSDLIITATASRAPLIEAAWLRPGQHLTAVGGDDGGKYELAPECLALADRLVVDSLELNTKYGDVEFALRRGLTTEETIYGELGQVLAGDVPGRQSDDDITIAKLVGLGVQDLAAVTVALEKLGSHV